jgi:NADH-quinone oxidoreductase subunit A
MIESYLPVLLLLVVAIGFPLGLLAVTSMLGPRQAVAAKSESYECGVPPVGDIRQKLPVKFYRLAILFLLFDVEIALLFPWAVLFRKSLAEWGASFLVAELFLFLLVLVVGYVYAYKKGALEWD